MKFGVCTDIQNVSLVKKAGFDYLECTVVSLMPETEHEYEEIVRKYQESPLPIETCNILLPSTLKIVGEAVDQRAIKQYVEKALPRVKQIGADTVVFGSGGARSAPENFPRSKAEQQIVSFLQLIADVAEPLGLTVVIEPLNKKESNMINSVPEAVEFASKVNRKSIQVLADFYHMDEESEQLTNIVDASEWIKHIHVADTGRLAPGTGTYPYAAFADCLREANYSRRVSIECKWSDLESELTTAMKHLQYYITG